MTIFAAIYPAVCAITFALRFRLFLVWKEDAYALRATQERHNNNIVALMLTIVYVAEEAERHEEIKETRALIARAAGIRLKAKALLLKFVVAVGFVWGLLIAICMIALPYYWQPALIAYAVYVLVGFYLLPKLQHALHESVKADYANFNAEMMRAEIRLHGGEPMM